MDPSECASSLSRLQLVAGLSVALAVVLALGYTIAFIVTHRRRDVTEAALRRELEFWREAARFEGLPKHLTRVWRQ